jgi:hypothetical protein
MTDQERTTLQRRIKNQRKALRLLNKTVVMQATVIARYRAENLLAQKIWMRHAASVADRYFGGGRIAKALRNWS